MKKNISEGFKFPAECLLKEKGKSRLLEKSKGQGGGGSPFLLCEKWKECPRRAHLECFDLYRGQQKKMIQESKN